MNRLLIVIAIMLSLAVTGYTQQDPNDPGIQDSLIIGEMYVDSGSTFAFMPIFIVTDDSVDFFNTPFKWTSPGGGIRPGSGVLYFPPLGPWEINDSVYYDESYIRCMGGCYGSNCVYLNTGGQRVIFLTIRFIITREAPRQLVVIDTSIWDGRDGPIVFGLNDGITEITPAVVRGYLGYGVRVNNDINIRPQSISLSQNYPNPFNSSTEIEFSLPQSGSVSIVIYDIQGREVRRLLDGNFEAGSHSVIWNGFNDDSQPVSSGIYFYKLNSGDATQTNRMTLLR